MKLLLADSDDDERIQLQQLHFLDSVRVGGMILTPASDPSSSVRDLARHGIPVIIANYNPRRENNCAVLVDIEQVGYIAAATGSSSDAAVTLLSS
jgi:DNA-binding LacI/PurR family transcriptional regulator